MHKPNPKDIRNQCVAEYIEALQYDRAPLLVQLLKLLVFIVVASVLARLFTPVPVRKPRTKQRPHARRITQPAVRETSGFFDTVTRLRGNEPPGISGIPNRNPRPEPKQDNDEWSDIIGD